MGSLKRYTTAEFTALYHRQVETIYRVCYSYLHNSDDSEDAVQSVFLKLLNKPQDFVDNEHEKAWLIRVAANHCKDLLKSSWNKRSSIENIPEPTAPADEYDDTLELIMALPEHCRVSLYLYYYEGYKASEIAKMCGYAHSTVRNYLSDGRKLLREKLVDFDD